MAADRLLEAAGVAALQLPGDPMLSHIPAAFDPTVEHLAALASCVTAGAALCLAARLRPGGWTRPAAGALGVFLVVSEAAWIVLLVVRHAWTPALGLPLHICDAAMFLAAAALWTRRLELVELLYFWACAGTVQGLLTPDVPEPFPGLLFFQYYAAHGGLVVAALFLVVGLRLTPAVGAVRRAALLTLVYTAGVALADLVTGGDYMYLREPPPVHTLFDLMGPWPWYLASAAVLGLVLFLLLYAPFWWGSRRRARQRGRARHASPLHWA